MSSKYFIKNSHDQKLAVVVNENSDHKGLAFVMHGLGGFKEQPQMITMAEPFFENGYTTVLFDVANTIGESEGSYEKATIGSYYQDLEDVISWAKGQDWHIEPFCLIGHSLGGFCVAYYAENNPAEVKAIAPIATVVSGKISADTEDHKRHSENWKKTGWKISESNSKPGTIKKLPWSFVEDSWQYDLLPEVDKLAMPVFMAVGDEDTCTPLNHQQILFEALLGRKELNIINNSRHTFRNPDALRQLKQLLGDWVKKM